MTIKDNNKLEIIVSAEDKIDVSNSQEFERKLQIAYNQGYEQIIIDFKNVTRIDTCGLGKLLSFYKKIRVRNGELRIINLTNDYIKKMFKMIKLNKIIDIEGIE
ncbi:STAS domain-containing protein [Natroniella sulfidigena]|uniref:STAS domain-containing protein n=1 Tax=Natroniella sulfidigena TaxID=723921 RepID=UPI00200B7D79|nr:STAS domain-containing protein [Natroniella sulfidigena]MCK8817682.1 STAS domain-containing protein [Natroniella sulfidigena]